MMYICVQNQMTKWTILGIGYVNKEHLPAIFLVTNDHHIFTLIKT